MSLGLPQQCQQRLGEKIAEQLPLISVQNKKYLEHWSAAKLRQVESILPQHGPVKEKLEEYISETPIFDFVYETLSKELYEGQE
jgi:hypothetical protein